MKFLNPLIIVFAFLLSACSEDREVSYLSLVFRNGIAYEVNSNIPFNGKTIDRFPDGQIGMVFVFDDGKKTFTEDYYRNGQVQETKNYTAGILNGTSKAYYENGQLRYKGSFKNGKQDGPWEQYRFNGQIWYKGSYKNDKKQGPWEYYFPNGGLDPDTSGTYQNGVKISD